MIYEYDARSEKCPVPLVQLRLLLKKMSNDDFCLLKISDQGSIKDIPKLLTKQGFTYDESWLEKNTLELFIRKANDTSFNRT
ncbi:MULTISPECIES: sulfurtransferase TusA family protein [unclassified Colwellia]|uniref:sulfurtransferase TusA family protein n=1 Tax=unclassified Colwellia TaxID=196834 RepID=UPI0015F459CA|nr:MULTISPECIES: sulfurtransferase TusA family protein [unclassified Colwellia]MBA6234147.1 sulfurtransferase TusA family protein [Colwellia sp. MB02u-7]MBA6237931.1 sulfurtransferase TusA family protein [Colwellia sp. MB02u-11]MBA6257756.1 sulfurtransferase TusA family protein [Colwellia sp. MB3u-28]MBA6259513.1 sulfurtransferase TusA family protein [Colwellia sp. MB3u-41]MBA6300821.1 sulfurtransferase TusA family protein [Colwellia sp. MB3u-22]